MFNKKLSIAALALSTVASGSAFATENDGYKVDLDLRTFYMDRDWEVGEDTLAAGQAFKLSVASPYYGGVIGFDATVTHVVELMDDKTIRSSDVLTPEGNGYTTVENLYVKLKPAENVNLRAGRMVMMTPLLNDLQSRLSAPSTQAVFGEASFDNAGVYAFYSDEASKNNSESFTEYRANGEDYSIASLGGTYKFANGVSSHIQYAVADDYLKQSFFNVTYSTKLSDYDVTLDAIHMRGSDDGALYGSDYDSNLTSLTAKFAKGNWAYTVNYQTVGGDDGYNIKWGGQDDTQFFTYGAVQLLDFNANDIQALQFRVDYDVPSLPGLHLMARHTEGWDIDTGSVTDGERRETNFDAKYTVQSGKAKDLSVQLRVAHVDGNSIPRINDVRLIMDYPINLL
ncbi:MULTISPECIES: OprD family outer membrane porin [unclassified Neptuniibacter]|uniref:OprD family outer membrane porin n=1 Tax=unclassified Neptuniibacter TaxID=2630693 RepID=UPI000C399AA9|nr:MULTISPECIES: OprD family outer membrane porin [unclassified Neptuniibacter]MAY43625.1 outer membrane porin, OprD family [Oceanospirillaceae bacterium]|tara:strand:+ start:13527 stop:14720 length:1194 start_codon:yes stop_codon:yes gene_type:complete